MTLRSGQFDDIYFSVENGLAETNHVFLQGNNLPVAWQDGRQRFVIAETGFGTGLNFLAVWTLFEKTARADQRLHFISFEKYPLLWDDIAPALAPWRGEFGGRLDRLRALYPLRVPGFHRLPVSEQVTLTLIFDDVNDALPQLDVPCSVDAWFLDGFAPSKNPQMWTEGVFAQMARLSHAGSAVATFTVAGVVRRGLEQAGFTVEKKTGYGRKREMLTASYRGTPAATLPPSPRRIAIIGGGLAGTVAAHVLRQQGITPVIFEQGDRLASGASGNAEGLYNPRLAAQRTPVSDFYTAAWAQAVRSFSELQTTRNIGFNPCGSLHLATDAEREKKFRGALAHWGWDARHMHWLEPAEAAQRAGVPLRHAALCLPNAGTVSPAALCRVWSGDGDIRLRTAVQDIVPEACGWRVNDESFDAVILACGAAVTKFSGLAGLPVHAVRGQLTEIKANAATAPLKMNLCFGGYLSPPRNGVHQLGASFQRWLDDGALRPEDDADNIARLAAILPGLGPVDVSDGRVGFRTASKDRFPLIGPVPGCDGIYLSAAHGSHGIISALAGAHLLADMMTGGPFSLSRATISALAPARFRRPA